MKKLIAALATLFIVEALALSTANGQMRPAVMPQRVDSRPVQFMRPAVMGPTFLLKEARIPDLNPMERVLGGRLIIGQRSMDLNVMIVLNCSGGKVCPMYVPAPITARLPIVKREMSNCGDRYTAELNLMNADGSNQRIEFTDYSRATCMTVTPQISRATYTISYMDHFARRMITKQAEFDFDQVQQVR